ncbi:MAG: DUF1700 domain-containing protein [Lachnospiraceae bacterium]|nr:DUF1700 domain-containing protein [Lachnospiraceae bacterium]
MNREEFMQALERALYDIPAEEKEAALQYYNEYFDDAGAENEQDVLKSLGAPEKLAESIRNGMDENGLCGEFTETGFGADGVRDYPAQTGEAGRGADKAERDGEYRETGKSAEDGTYPDGNETAGKRKMHVWKWIAVILLCVLAAPVCIPLLVTAASVVFALLTAIAAVIAVFAAVGAAVFIGGIALALVGIAGFAETPAGGLILIGAGMVLTAVGFLTTVFFVWALLKFSVMAFRAFVELCRKPFHRGKEARSV